MTDSAVSPISNINPNVRANAQVNAGLDRAQPAEPAASGSKPAAKVAAPEKPEKSSEPREYMLTGPDSDVSLKFRVDPKTHDISVFVIDRATRQVVRTIPADEYKKLQASDLLKLLA